jgi:hypothetical protein
MSHDMCARRPIRYKKSRLGTCIYNHPDYINLILDNGQHVSLVKPSDVEFLDIMKIDITKPLEITSTVTSEKPVPVKLLGIDSTGNLIVDLTGTPKDSEWMIFTPEGAFHRSPNGGGRALTLKNEVEKITHRFTASFIDGGVFFGPTIGPACDVQIVTQGDKITSIVARAE